MEAKVRDAFQFFPSTSSAWVAPSALVARLSTGNWPLAATRTVWCQTRQT